MKGSVDRTEPKKSETAVNLVKPKPNQKPFFCKTKPFYKVIFVLIAH